MALPCHWDINNLINSLRNVVGLNDASVMNMLITLTEEMFKQQRRYVSETSRGWRAVQDPQSGRDIHCHDRGRSFFYECVSTAKKSSVEDAVGG